MSMRFVALLSVNGIPAWGTVTRRGQYVIVGKPGKYTASFKKTAAHQRTDIIAYEVAVETFGEAEEACKKFDRGLQ